METHFYIMLVSLIVDLIFIAYVLRIKRQRDDLIRVCDALNIPNSNYHQVATKLDSVKNSTSKFLSKTLT